MLGFLMIRVLMIRDEVPTWQVPQLLALVARRHCQAFAASARRNCLIDKRWTHLLRQQQVIVRQRIDPHDVACSEAAP